MISCIAVVTFTNYSPKNIQADSQTVAMPIKVNSLEDESVPQFDLNSPGMQENPIPADSKDPSDLESAINDAPDGLQIANLFELGTFQGNSARIINKINETDKTGSLLQVTNNINQLGSIWGKLNNYNYIDVSKNQTLSMWLYFGRENPETNLVGDGMAFVLQNGGANAISTFHAGMSDQKYGYGESLGVWGTDFFSNIDRYPRVSERDIAKTAIPKSFAIEFDTFNDREANGDTIDGNGNSFDYLLEPYQHIAEAYPASPDTYRKDASHTGQYKNIFEMNHGSNVKYFDSDNKMTDGKWHHITIQYDYVNSSTGTLSYSFDDKDKFGVRKEQQIESRPITIDFSKFDLKDGNTKLRWGFTGSTGRYFENNLISFESVPSFVNGNVETSLYDDTQKKDISSTNKNVSTGDELTFKYTLNYLSGIKPWENTEANITIPDEVSAKSIDILYADHSTAKVPIDATKNSFKFNLSNALRDHDPNNPHAIISVHTTVNDVNQETLVKAAHSRFKSKYLIEDAESPEFNIKVANLSLQVITPANNHFPSVESIPKNLPVKYKVWERNPKNNSVIKIFSSINGDSAHESETLPTYTQQNQINTLFVDGRQLHFGVNHVDIYAKDMGNNLRTPTKTILFFVSGPIEFGEVSKSISFDPITSKSSDKLIKRRNNWKIQVIDDRWYNPNDPQKNKWELQVKASPLISGTYHRFNGQMIFKDHNGVSFSLDENPKTIFYGSKTTEGTQTIDVTNSWQPNNGILLKQNGGNNGGVYHSILTWSLVDGPK